MKGELVEGEGFLPSISGLNILPCPVTVQIQGGRVRLDFGTKLAYDTLSPFLGPFNTLAP